MTQAIWQMPRVHTEVSGYSQSEFHTTHSEIKELLTTKGEKCCQNLASLFTPKQENTDVTATFNCEIHQAGDFRYADFQKRILSLCLSPFFDLVDISGKGDS